MSSLGGPPLQILTVRRSTLKGDNLHTGTDPEHTSRPALYAAFTENTALEVIRSQYGQVCPSHHVLSIPSHPPLFSIKQESEEQPMDLTGTNDG